MANDSSTGGYLVPSDDPTSAPVQDFGLDAIFQKLIVGLTGLPGSLVRPRWQPVAPRQPDVTTDWCAIGVTDIEPDNDPVFYHAGQFEDGVVTNDTMVVTADGTPVDASNTNGQDNMQRQKVISLLASFYGPNGMANADQAADGLYVCQNQGILGSVNIGLVDVSNVTPAPDLINQMWVRRYDFTIRVRRQTKRTYSILNLLELQASINADGLQVNVSS